MNPLGKTLSLHWSLLGPSYSAVFMFRPRLSIFILNIWESEVQYIVSSMIVAYNVKDCKAKNSKKLHLRGLLCLQLDRGPKSCLRVGLMLPRSVRP